MCVSNVSVLSIVMPGSLTLFDRRTGASATLMLEISGMNLAR